MGFADFQRLLAEREQGTTPNSLDAALAARGADRGTLLSQYATPAMSLGEAARKDAEAMGSLDPTNPSNLPGILHHGIPIALQALVAGRGGPGAAQGIGRLAQAARSGLGSLLGYGFQEGVEPAIQGQAPNLDTKSALLNFLLGGTADLAVQGAGGAMRRVTGKSAMLREGAAAEATALDDLLSTRRNAEMSQVEKRSDVARKAELGALEGQAAYDASRVGAVQEQKARLADVAKSASEKARLAQEAAATKVASRKQAVDLLRLKHSEDALNYVRKNQEDQLERQVRDFIGAPSPLENPTIETLSQRAAPVRESVERNVRSVFRGLSTKFETTLLPYYDTPVVGNFANAVDAERGILASNKEDVGKSFSKLMDEVAMLDTSAGLNVGSLPPALQAEYRRLQSQMPKEALEKYIGAAAKGMQGGAASAAAVTDVRAVDRVRSKLVGTVIGSASPVEKRIATRLISNLDDSLEPVLPEGVRADWANLRREWREANSVFSPRFRSTLFLADSPAAVADVLYGASKGNKAHRALTVIGQTPADERPLLKSAFAERMTQGDVVKNLEGMDPRVFRSLFGDSGFESPQAFIEATQQNLVRSLDMERVAADPKLYARYNERFREGMNSLGTKKAQLALERAEAILKRTPDPAKAIRGALDAELTPEQAADMALRGKTRPSLGAARDEALAGELTPSQAGDVATAGMERPAEARLRGEMEGMRTPLGGKSWQSYVEHRHAWHVAMGLSTLGAFGPSLLSHPTQAILPIAYLGSSRAAAWALSDAKYGKLWHSYLKSKNFEQAGFWLGRLSAASLTEGTRSIAE